MKYVFLAPWKVPKKSNLFDFYNEFYSRISKQVSCDLITSSSALSDKESIFFYEKEIKKFSTQKPVCFAFDENGTPYTSQSFAKELARQEVLAEKCILFCFGGAYGLPKEILPLVRLKAVSLSLFTFSHELAFCVALEQIYRARCILENHPYHHGEKSSLIKEIKK